MKMKTGFLVVATLMVFSRGTMAADLPSALVDPYLLVQAALSADQFDGVALQAQAIEMAAATLGKDGADLAASAKTLVAAKDLAAARTAFGNLSAALTAYAEKTKSSFGPGIRLAYCPMAAKPWLTKDKDIRNPYYGKAMLTCGSFKS